jgi:hypothetical protein
MLCMNASITTNFMVLHANAIVMKLADAFYLLTPSKSDNPLGFLSFFLMDLKFLNFVESVPKAASIKVQTWLRH